MGPPEAGGRAGERGQVGEAETKSWNRKGSRRQKTLEIAGEWRQKWCLLIHVIIWRGGGRPKMGVVGVGQNCCQGGNSSHRQKVLAAASENNWSWRAEIWWVDCCYHVVLKCVTINVILQYWDDGVGALRRMEKQRWCDSWIQCEQQDWMMYMKL